MNSCLQYAFTTSIPTWVFQVVIDLVSSIILASHKSRSLSHGIYATYTLFFTHTMMCGLAQFIPSDNIPIISRLGMWLLDIWFPIIISFNFFCLCWSMYTLLQSTISITWLHFSSWQCVISYSCHLKGKKTMHN